MWLSELYYDNSQLDLAYGDTRYALKGLPQQDVLGIMVTGSMKLLETDTVNILTDEYNYVCAPIIGNNVVANSNHPWDWETFIMRKYIGNLYTFECANHNFLTAVDAINTEINSEYGQNQPACVFRFVNGPNGKVILKTNKCFYVTLDKKNNNALITGTENVIEGTLFTIVRKK